MIDESPLRWSTVDAAEMFQVPRCGNGYFSVSQNGNVDTVRSAILVYPELSITSDDSNLNLEQRNGLLYSTVNAEQGVINLKLKANYTLSPNQTVTELFIETRVVDEAYYNYHSKLTKQILLEQNNLGEPVITRSNIVNGYGVFSAYAVRATRIG